MKPKIPVLTRRDFLRDTGGLTLGLSLLGPGWLKAAEENKDKSLVLIARNKEVMDADFKVNKTVLKELIDQVVTRLTGKASPNEAWLSLVSPGDVVGLVPTPLMNPTHEELIEVIKESLIAVGILEGNIRRAQGRSINLEPITALISLPGLKAHWLTGIGTVIKNYILYSGAPRNYHYEDSAKLGEIWHLPQVKGKTRLIIVDALYPVCDKGPQVDPRYRWPYKGLIAGFDPVAIDAVGMKIIEEKRKEIRGEPWPLSPPPISVKAADKVYKLGNSDFKKIDIQSMGWKEGLLV